MVKRLVALLALVALTSCEYRLHLQERDGGAPSPDAWAPDAPVPGCEALLVDAPTSASCPSPDALCRRVVVTLPAGPWAVGPNPVTTGDAGVYSASGGRVVEIDAFEVTVARYRRFQESNGGADIGAMRVATYPDGSMLSSRGSAARTDSALCTMTGASRDAQPVNCVDWDDANAFCAWDGGRLLTRVELEYVRRWWERAEVPAPGAAGRLYPWGDDEPHAHFTTYPASFPFLEHTSPAEDVNDVGIGCLFGIAGSVGEWLGDEARARYDDGCLSDGFCEGTPGAQRSVATGAWIDDADSWLLSSAIGSSDPTTANPRFGIRCAYDRH